MGKEQHNYFLLLVTTTATCATVGVASFVILPLPSPHYPIPMELFLIVTTSIGMQMWWCLVAIGMQIGVALQLVPPHELFSYDAVFMHWIFTAESLGLASAGVGLVYSERFRHSSCGGSSRPVCRNRCELSSWLALAMATISIVDALVMRWATRRTHGAVQAC